MATRPHSSAARLARDIKAVNWAKLPVGDAFELLMAMRGGITAGGKAVAEIVQQLQPVVQSQVQQSSPPPVFPPAVEPAPPQISARVCSICGDPAKPLNKEEFGPWISQGMCKRCFVNEADWRDGREQ